MTTILFCQRNFFARSWTIIGQRRAAATTSSCGSYSRRSSSLPMSVVNHLDDKKILRNDYFALRHGQSLANVAKIIASDPKVATKKYGLSDLGKEQAQKAGGDVIAEFQKFNNYNGIIILCSDLLRAKETAEIVSLSILKEEEEDDKIDFNLYNNGIVIETRLRERGFGNWDGGSDEHYSDVWRDDAIDPNHEENGVESVASVTDRSTSMIVDFDERFENYMIICVAHGDVLQILQTAFSRMDGSLHRTLQHLETASLRRLTLASSSSSSSSSRNDSKEP